MNTQKYIEIKLKLLNKHCVKEEVRRKTRKHFVTTENKNTTWQNLWNTVEVPLKAKFRLINTYT
jgi:hypothetical protein